MRNIPLRAAVAAVVLVSAATLPAPVMAFDPMSWMSPGRWLGNDRGYGGYGYGAPGYHGGYPAPGYGPGYMPGYGAPYGPGYPGAAYAPAPLPAPDRRQGRGEEAGQERYSAGDNGRFDTGTSAGRGDVRTYPPQAWDGQGDVTEGGGHGWAPAPAGGDGRRTTADYWQRNESRPEPRWGQEGRSGYGVDRDPQPEWHGGDQGGGGSAARERYGAPGRDAEGAAGTPGAGPMPRTGIGGRPATATGDDFVKRLDNPPLPPAARGPAADWWNAPMQPTGPGNGPSGGPGAYRGDDQPAGGNRPDAPR